MSTDNSYCEINKLITEESTDGSGRLRLSNLMKLHQEVSEQHLSVFGTPSDTLRNEFGIAFVFTKIRINIYRLPAAGERVTVKTWCSMLKGVRFTRNYRVTLQNSGELLTESKAEVTVIDLNTRKIIRPKDIKVFESFLYNDVIENGCAYPEKLPVSVDVAPQFSRHITASDIDWNGHVNNTVYADMVTDCIPEDRRNSALSCFEVNYSNEVKPNDTVQLALENNGRSITAVGCVGDKHSFTARLDFKL